MNKITTPKTSYKKADVILDTKFPMFDRKTNKMFGTIWVYELKLNWETIWILEKQRVHFTEPTYYKIRLIREITEDKIEAVEKHYWQFENFTILK